MAPAARPQITSKTPVAARSLSTASLGFFSHPPPGSRTQDDLNLDDAGETESVLRRDVDVAAGMTRLCDIVFLTGLGAVWQLREGEAMRLAWSSAISASSSVSVRCGLKILF